MNLYNVYFVSKGTGPQTIQIEAQNSAGAKAQVELWTLTIGAFPASKEIENENDDEDEGDWGDNRFRAKHIRIYRPMY